MKRATPRHPKVGELADHLGIEIWGAVGILESLWHFTAQYARRGDIGRWPNARIASGVAWRDDPDRLVDALVESRWLDRCAKHRLLVHDWQDHADDSVKKTLKVHDESFCTPEPFANDSGMIPESFAPALAVAVAIASSPLNPPKGAVEGKPSKPEAPEAPQQALPPIADVTHPPTHAPDPERPTPEETAAIVHLQQLYAEAFAGQGKNTHRMPLGWASKIKAAHRQPDGPETLAALTADQLRWSKGWCERERKTWCFGNLLHAIEQPGCPQARGEPADLEVKRKAVADKQAAEQAARQAAAADHAAMVSAFADLLAPEQVAILETHRTRNRLSTRTMAIAEWWKRSKETQHAGIEPGR